MRWLITGVGGFLGANAARVLGTDADVVGLARSGEPLPWCSQVVAADLVDPSSLAMAVRDAEPDVVLHCAAMADHHACEEDEAAAMRINAEASGVLADVSSSVGAQFVYVSTDAVFAGDRGWYSEEDPVCPTNAYGRSKAAGEEVVRAAHASAVIARTNFFGWSPSGHRSILEFFVHELGAGNRVRGFVNYTVTSLFVEDVVGSIREIVDSRESGVFHVVSEDAVTKADFGHVVASEFGLDESLIDPVDMEGPAKDLSLRSGRLSALRGAPMPTQADGVARAKGSPRF